MKLLRYNILEHLYAYVIYSAYVKCIYICMGVTTTKPNETSGLLSSNKSRPHLSTWIVISEGQEGVVQLREQWWILPWVSKHEAFP